MKKAVSQDIQTTQDLKFQLELKNLNCLSQAKVKRVADIRNGNLPTIAEDQIENDTIDFAKLGQKEKRLPESRQQSKRNLRIPSAARVGSQVSSSQHHQRDRYNLPSARLPDLQEIGSRQASQNSRQPSAARERTHERPPMNPRSADVYVSKNKQYYSQAASDQEDASTSVSTRSQVRRHQPGSLGAPINYSHHGQHVS